MENHLFERGDLAGGKPLLELAEFAVDGADDFAGLLPAEFGQGDQDRTVVLGIGGSADQVLFDKRFDQLRGARPRNIHRAGDGRKGNAPRNPARRGFDDKKGHLLP